MTLAPNVYDAEPIPEAARAEIDRLLASGDLFRYTAPENAPVALLEREFAKLLGTKYALAVSSCSAALFLSLLGLGLKPGTKVLIPGFTFAAVPSAVIHANCRPVLVEVGQNYRIDLEDFAARLTDEVGAVIISHMRGHTSDMDAIMALCDAAGVPVVEDAAHSLGTLWNGRNIGTLGRVGCFSFQSYKLINSGEGGILGMGNNAIVHHVKLSSERRKLGQGGSFEKVGSFSKLPGGDAGTRPGKGKAGGLPRAGAPRAAARRPPAGAPLPGAARAAARRLRARRGRGTRRRRPRRRRSPWARTFSQRRSS